MNTYEQMTKPPEWITLLYTIKESRKHSFKTKDGKTHIMQHKEIIGVHMSKKEFKKRRLKAKPYTDSDSILISTRKIVVKNNSAIRADLMRQGWIKLGLIPEPDFAIHLPTTIPDRTFIVPIVESSHKKMTFLNETERKIFSALVGKTLICVGHNKFEILEK